MKIAFLVVAHTSLPHLVNLVNSISHPDASFFIHIDARNPIDMDSFSGSFHGPSAIHFVEPRLNVVWGGFSLTDISLRLMKTAFVHGSFEYYYIISGQDFPIKPISDIIDYLSANKGREFLEHFVLPDAIWGENGGMDRLDYYWLIDEMGMDLSKMFVESQKREGVRRTIPLGLTPYGGSNWYALTQDCVTYLIDQLTENPCIIDFFQYTLLADEILIPTLIMNSPFCKRVVNNNLRYIDWVSGPEKPRILTVNDLGKILESERQFARKFDPEKDSDIIACLASVIKS